MGWWIFRNARERELNRIYRELIRIRKYIEEGGEEDEPANLWTELDAIKSALLPEGAQRPPVPADVIRTWNELPGWQRLAANMAVRSFAGVSVDEAIRDPTGAKMNQLLAAAGPYLPKNLLGLVGQGQQGSQQAPGATATQEAPFYTQPYRPTEEPEH